MKTTLFELMAVSAFATIDGCEVEKIVRLSEPHQLMGIAWCGGDDAAEFRDQELTFDAGQSDFQIVDVEGRSFTLACYGDRPLITLSDLAQARAVAAAGALHSMASSDEKARAIPFTLQAVTFDMAPQGTAIPAYLDGRRWNGWRMPYFPESSMAQLMALCPDVSYDADRDAYVISTDGAPEDSWAVHAETIQTADGQAIKTYPVGAGAWTWDVAHQGATDSLELNSTR